MFDAMDTRTKLGVCFVGLVAIIAVLLVLDQTVFRPREPVYAITDKETLEREIKRVIAATSNVGSWGGVRTIHRSRLVVSANLDSQFSVQQTLKLLTETLKENSWKVYSLSHSSALATFCKARYRLNVWRLDDGRISVSLLVKEFERDTDCAV